MELIDAFRNGHILIAESMVKYGRNIDVNYIDELGYTPLIYAVNPELTVSNVIEFNKEYIDKYGNNDIVYKLYNKIAENLLNRGANPNIGRDEYGDTVLHNAVTYGETEIVELLLEKGANPFIKDSEGETAYDIAMYSGFSDIIKLLKHYMRIYRIQALQRGKLTRRKLRTSMARRRSALSRLGDTHGLGEDIIQMINSRMTRPSHVDMIDETPHYMRGSGKNPCLENYKMVGMKNKNGKRVPNCVSKNL
jgi:uncharacterized protein